MKKILFILPLMISPLLAETAVLQAPSALKDVQQTSKPQENLDALVIRVMEAVAMKTMLHDTMKKSLAMIPAAFPPLPEGEGKVAFQKMMGGLEKKLPDIVDKMMVAIRPIYLKYFNQADLESQLAFYQTPSGRKYVKAMGGLAERMMKMIMPMINPTLPLPATEKADEKDAFFALAKEFQVVSKVDALRATMMADAFKNIDAMIAGAPEEQKEVLKGQKKRMTEVLGVAEKNILAQLLAYLKENYSMDEARALIAFLKTPAGQKMVDATGPMQKDMMAMNQTMMMGIMGELMQDMMQSSMPKGPRKDAEAAKA